MIPRITAVDDRPRNSPPSRPKIFFAAHAQGRARIEKQKGFSVNSDAFMVSLIKAL